MTEFWHPTGVAADLFEDWHLHGLLLRGGSGPSFDEVETDPQLLASDRSLQHQYLGV